MPDLVPTAMHPWYAVWILPFVAVRSSAAWLWFTGAVTFSYFKYAWYPTWLPLWLWALEFLPVYGLLAWEWRSGDLILLSRIDRTAWRPEAPRPSAVGAPPAS